MRSDILILPMRYAEQSYKETEACLSALGTGNIIYAERDGIGSMSRAWNDAFQKSMDLPFFTELKYVWFPTNITFTSDVPDRLAATLDSTGGGAVCPEYLSDHAHLRPISPGGCLVTDFTDSPLVQEVPFIEFTAPMIRADVFRRFPLDEEFMFYWFDLVFSRELRLQQMTGSLMGKTKMYCDHSVKIEHTYLRNNQKKEKISLLREQFREYRNSIELPRLREKFGENWKKELCIGW